MSTTVRVRPTAVFAPAWARGTFAATGAASLQAAVSDVSDSSYIALTGAYTAGGGAGASVSFFVGNLSLPAGARIQYMKAGCRIATTAGTRTVYLRLHDSRIPTGAPGVYPTGQKDYVQTSTITAGTTITDFTGQGESAAPPPGTSKLADQTYINNMALEIWGPGLVDTVVRVYELYVDVTYVTAPAALNVAPSGITLSTTSAPTFSWTYAAEFAQQSYWVKIYDSAGTTLVYDSGAVNSSNQFHRMTQNLPNGSYKWTLALRQAWNHEDLSNIGIYAKSGQFWSPWLPLASFTLTSIQPAQPSIAIEAQTANLGKVSVAALTNQNLFDYSGQSFELSVSQWATSNATLAVTAAPFRSGGQSAFMTATATNGTIKSIMVPVTTTAKYGFSFWAQKPASGGTTSVTSFVDWYDGTTSGPLLISSTTGPSITTAIGSWAQGVTTALVPPAGALYAQVRVVVATNAQTAFLDDMFLWATDTTPGLAVVPSPPNYAANSMRGGLVNPTANTLSYDESSTEGAATTWAAHDANTALVLSSTQKFHGTQSLRVTRVGTTGTASIDLCTTPSLAVTGTSTKYFPVTPGNITSFVGAIFSTVARSAFVQITAYDANFNSLYVLSNPLTTTLNAWTRVNTPALALDNSVVYVSLSAVVSTSVAVGELHYWDDFALISQPTLNANVAYSSQPWPEGYQQFATSLVLEYQDAGTSTWSTLATYVPTPGNVAYLYDDYEVASGLARTYRVTLAASVNNNTHYSASSAPVVATEALSNVWLHTLDNPAGTIYNFRYDGDGAGGNNRSESVDTNPVPFQAAGRPYPIVSFGEDRKRKVSVKVQLASAADQAAFGALARYQGLVMLRDQRGRRGRGYISNASLQDNGPGQIATFDFNFAGTQVEG